MAFNITDFNNKWANFKEELRGFLNRSVDKTGDTMAGSLVLSKDPTADMEAATKKYVDGLTSTFIPGSDRFLNFGGVSFNEVSDINAGQTYTQRKTAPYYSLANGTILPKITIQKFSIRLLTKASSSSTYREVNWTTDADAFISIKYYINFNNNNDILVWEENNISVHSNKTNPNSILCAPQTITLDSLAINKMDKPSIKAEMIFHSVYDLPVGQDRCIYHTPSSVTIEGGISNQILDTSIIYV